MNYTGKRPTPVSKVLAKMEPDSFAPYPAPFICLTNNRRASAPHWADSHLNFCSKNFRFWSGNSNGQTFSHGERGVNF